MAGERKHKRHVQRPLREAAPAASLHESVYRADTPLWRRYYERVRGSIRFPRYYKRSANE